MVFPLSLRWASHFLLCLWHRKWGEIYLMGTHTSTKKKKRQTNVLTPSKKKNVFAWVSFKLEKKDLEEKYNFVHHNEGDNKCDGNRKLLQLHSSSLLSSLRQNLTDLQKGVWTKNGLWCWELRWLKPQILHSDTFNHITEQIFHHKRCACFFLYCIQIPRFVKSFSTPKVQSQ